MNEKKRIKTRESLKMKRCRYCLATDNLTIDHKIPVIKGGSDDLKNLQCLCKRCNGMKSAMTHNQLKSIWRWLNDIQDSRLKKGKRPYFTIKTT